MKASSKKEVQNLYDDSADWYDKMMEDEIDLPVYTDVLSRLAGRVSTLKGAAIDTSCGSGHMLKRYHEQYDQSRSLIGIDLSPGMVAIANKKLKNNAKIYAADMRDLSEFPSDSAAAVINYFSIHHLDPEDIKVALKEWYRVLNPHGQLVLATWEGSGPVDYGDASDIVALRFSKQEVAGWVEHSGFEIDRLTEEQVEESPMNAVYLEATKGM